MIFVIDFDLWYTVYLDIADGVLLVPVPKEILQHRALHAGGMWQWSRAKCAELQHCHLCMFPCEPMGEGQLTGRDSLGQAP